MANLTTLIISAMIVATASGFFKGKGKSETTHYEWSEAPKYEVIHHTEHLDSHHVEPKYEVVHHTEHVYSQEKEKGKKWSWWPWTKSKDHETDDHSGKGKGKKFWKLNKFKKTEAHSAPLVIIHRPAPVYHPQPIVHHHHHTAQPIIHDSHHITHSKIVDEIPEPVSIPHEVYHHETLSHESPVYHHKEEVHETHGEKPWKWSPETEHSAFQPESVGVDENQILSSFLGEGHSIETLEKLMPTLQKDKHLLQKLKSLHQIKSSWLPKFDHASHHDKKSLFKFLPKIFSSHSEEHPSVELQEVVHNEHVTHEHSLDNTGPHQFPDNHGPKYQQIHENHVPQHFSEAHAPSITSQYHESHGIPLSYLPVAYPIHQSVSTTVIEHPKKVYELSPQPLEQVPYHHHQNSLQFKPIHVPDTENNHQYEALKSHSYEDHQSPNQLHNSYGEPIPSDSYSSPSEKVEVVAPPPKTTPEAGEESSEPNEHEEISKAESDQDLSGTK